MSVTSCCAGEQGAVVRQAHEALAGNVEESVLRGVHEVRILIVWVGDGAGASCRQGRGCGVAAGCLAVLACVQGGIEYPLLKGASK